MIKPEVCRYDGCDGTWLQRHGGRRFLCLKCQRTFSVRVGESEQKQRRLSAGMTVRKLAGYINVSGVTPVAILEWEDGRRELPAVAVRRMKVFLEARR